METSIENGDTVHGPLAIEEEDLEENGSVVSSVVDR